MVSTMSSPEVVEYPDKVGAISWQPGGTREDAFVAFSRRNSSVDYFDGES